MKMKYILIRKSTVEDGICSGPMKSWEDIYVGGEFECKEDFIIYLRSISPNTIDDLVKTYECYEQRIIDPEDKRFNDF